MMSGLPHDARRLGRTLRFAAGCAGLSLLLGGCGLGEISARGVETRAPGGEGGTGGGAEGVLVTSGYVLSAFGFFYPESLESQIPGFDLDQRISSKASPGADECAHDDFTSPDGKPGIDYNFLQVILTDEMTESGEYVFGGFRKGQIVDGVINGAVKNGSMTVLLDVQGVDDPQNDDEVTVQIFASEDAPMKGTDDSVLPYATLSVHPDPAFHSAVVAGTIVDGTLIAGPIDLVVPIDIQIVSDVFVVHDAWLRLDLGENAFSGILAGFWDVSNIRDIIGKPTTDNGNAANFTIEQFEEAMLDLADGDYDPNLGICTSFTTMFTFSGVQAFIARGSGTDPGTGGAGGAGPVETPVDQCIGPEDQAVLEEIGGAGAVGSVAAQCPTTSCGTELVDLLTGGGSEATRIALGNCIAQCISDATGLSRGCTDCYGSIAACSTSFCLVPCASDPGSAECAQCAYDNCPSLDQCTGL
jgi:hypothetical protein